MLRSWGRQTGPKLVLTMPLSNCSIPLYQASQRCDDARVCYLSNCLIIRYINHRKPMKFVQLWVWTLACMCYSVMAATHAKSNLWLDSNTATNAGTRSTPSHTQVVTAQNCPLQLRPHSSVEPSLRNWHLFAVIQWSIKCIRNNPILSN